MTASLAAALCEPIEDDAPCGPDLDLAYDPPYSLFMASAESMLPAESFFQYKRSDYDLPKESRAIEGLLKRTRDLRLLVLLAKFRLLNRELDGFAEAMTAMAALLRERWNEVHPIADDGDFGLRIVVLESLDDIKSVIMPLQHAPLTLSRRIGAVNYRMIQIAKGEVVAREGETAPDQQSIDTAFAEGDLAGLIESRDRIGAARTALHEMQSIVEEQGAGSLSLERLVVAVGKIATMLDEAVVRRDPSAAALSSSGTGGDPGDAATDAAPTASSPLETLGDIRHALLRSELYFRTCEPSSPALLLVAQARQLVGKGLAESVQLLVPDHASEAVINVGGRMVFDLPIERLAGLIDPGADDDGNEQADEPVIPSSRREALDILQQVASQLRVREPSSAIPLLCERARSLAERDFMSLLREMLPDRAFRNLDDN